MKLEQVLKQQQKLILSPQMQQAIHLLQLPLTELRQTAAQELMKNPLLEEIPDTDIEKGTSEELGEPASNKELNNEKTEADSTDDYEPENLSDYSNQENNDQNQNKEEQEVAADNFQNEFEKLTQLDDEWRDYFKQTATYSKTSSEEEEKRLYAENSITSEQTLEEHLQEQLSLNAQDEIEKKAGEYILGNLDSNGFLQTSLDEIAKELNISLEQVEKTLKLIQTFHPTGAGSRNLRECLMIQLQKMGQEKSLAAKIVGRHLELLAKRKIPQIAKLCNTTIEAIKSACKDIEQLDPKPGRLFSHNDNFYPIPEVIVQKNEDDEYDVILNNDKIPHLRINNLYRKLMQQDGDEKTKQYVEEKIKAALWFIRNIQQRQNTIQNISKEIVQIQKEFLEKGISELRPLTMQQVADVIGVHESTVSRAIANKYIQTPQGLFKFKYFFTGGIQTATGESASTTTIKEKIQELFQKEEKKKPLADQEVIEILAKQGIKMARRTVAKYRKELNILPSHLRREY